MSENNPLENGEKANIPEATGRRADGTFTKGCRPGPGNPYGNKTALFRRAIFAAVTEDDIQSIIRSLLKEAVHGKGPSKVAAAREILDRLLGKAVQAVTMSGPDGGPVRTLDLSKLKPDEIDILLRIHERISGESETAETPNGEAGA